MRRLTSHVRRLTAHVRRLPVRLRLTLIYAGVMTLLLTGLGLFLYFHFESGLDTALNQQLRARAGEVAALTRGGTVTRDEQIGGEGEGVAQPLSS